VRLLIEGVKFYRISPSLPPLSPAGPALPPPTPEAQAHSAALSRRIGAEIAASGGWIGFDRYMELALYAPGLGDYTGGSSKLGASGDFVTAPELSSLFSAALARQVAELLSVTGGALLELGAGSGRMAADLLLELDALGRLPERYLILEVSAELRVRQHERVVALPERLAARVHWLDRLPERFRGVVVANELLDALPVHLVAWREDGIAERGISCRGEQFIFDERPLVHGNLLQAASRVEPDRPYVSEIALAAGALVRSLAARLERGVLLFIDYGFGAAEYYHPQRSEGTLMCHYRHRAHADPLFWPGLQDISAHVDFSALVRAGTEAGLALLGYTTQTHFLVNLGITDLLARTPPERAAAYLRLAAQVQKLLSPSEMGELFKVIAFGRGVESPLSGFSRGDLSRLL
jgi:SAM-dependent MidA family methyltransferase